MIEVNNVDCCASDEIHEMPEGDAAARAAIFAALADPIRLRLLSLVASLEEVCSCNLEGPLNRSQPTISHHTKILSDAGLIVAERRGRWTWWRVSPEHRDLVVDLLGIPLTAPARSPIGAAG